MACMCNLSEFPDWLIAFIKDKPLEDEVRIDVQI